MTKNSAKKVAFISSFPPRKCGIATFTCDLINAVTSAAKGQFEPLVVAMRAGNDLRYDPPVKFEIRCNVKSDYICAADYINFSNVGLVSVQHEFGLFGGEAGSYLSLLVNKLNAPVITTLHTVLDEPDDAYRTSMVDICRASRKVITMNTRGVEMLGNIYGVAPDKIELIPHGIPDLPFVDSSYYKHKFGVEGRRTILTFGLLSRNKGIEVMLKAMPDIIAAEPSVLYIVLGMTHPSVLQNEGESYRLELQRIVNELGIQKHVTFRNRFVKDEELHNFLSAADIYVTPYLNREQLTSGTLSFAVGTGKAVVSTPYWAAMELLADGRGSLTPFADSKKLAGAIIELIEDSKRFYSLRRRAYDYGRSRTWPKMGQAYWKLFGAKNLPLKIAARIPAKAEAVSSIEVPEPSLAHLRRLTDDTGLYQHAKLTIPRREHGYCTDDNARALIVMTTYYDQFPDLYAIDLLDKYLSFVLDCQNSDGTVRNLMNFDRSWARNEPHSDALGRVLWALGTVMAKLPNPSYLSIVKEAFDKSVKHVRRQHPRDMAYSILGMSDYLHQFPGASDIKHELETAADGLLTQYMENRQQDWLWFADTMTYDNSILPCALLVAGLTLDNEKYTKTGLQICEFLLNNIFDGEHFSFVGCNGWFERGETKARFDQQPIEAASTVLMLRAAYDATNDNNFLTLQRKAFDWFLGENDLHIPLYDFRTKGCCDGLMAGGVNVNQGAESILSFLIALLAIDESRSITARPEDNIASAEPTTNIIDRIVKEFPSVKGRSAKGASKKNWIEEPA